MRRLISCAAALITLLALVAVGVHAAEPSGTVTGVVQGGGAVEGLTLVLLSTADSRYTGTGTTDAQGAFTVSEVPLGGVQLKVYGAEHQLLAQGKWQLQNDGQVLSVVLQIGSAP